MGEWLLNSGTAVAVLAFFIGRAQTAIIAPDLGVAADRPGEERLPLAPPPPPSAAA